jgi:hypothetical protein
MIIPWLTFPCGRSAAPKSRGYGTAGSQSEEWDHRSSSHRSIPGFFGGEETGLWFDTLWSCSLVITQHTSLPTVAILLCFTSSILERLLTYLIVVLDLTIPTILCLSIRPYSTRWNNTGYRFLGHMNASPLTDPEAHVSVYSPTRLQVFACYM